MERLDKILAGAGFGTRREVKALIKAGAVTVDGAAVRSADQKLDPERDKLCVGGVPVLYQKHITLMLNKPPGVISATQDNFHRTVIDLVPKKWAHRGLFPVGRLDIDTQGLLLLTDNGGLAHDLLSPAKGVPKVYFALLDIPPTAEDAAAFARGVMLDDGKKALPAVLEPSPEGAFVTVCEGRFHQVKRMFKSVGKEVTYLKRIRMGGLSLDETLAPGQMREITKEEEKRLWIY